MSRRPREMYRGHARLCVCLRPHAHAIARTRCNLGEWYGMPSSCALLGGLAIGARVALLWQHYGNAWQSPAVIHQAHRTPQTTLAANKIDAPAACALPFRLYCGGIVTRTRNVTEYMLVLALCLVSTFRTMHALKLPAVPHQTKWRHLASIPSSQLAS